MALTTADGTKLGQHIITDVNANIPVDGASKRQISQEAAILFNKSIVARPLGVPNVAEVQVKDNGYRYRWVPFKAQGGWLFGVRKSQGFTLATKDDVALLSTGAAWTDGMLTSGDVCLMKIMADRYDSALKSNMVKAQLLANARGFYLEGASSDVMSDKVANRRTVSSEAGARTGKATPFIPDNVDAIVDASISSGRVEETRAVVDELRAHNAAKKE